MKAETCNSQSDFYESTDEERASGKHNLLILKRKRCI